MRERVIRIVTYVLVFVLGAGSMYFVGDYVIDQKLDDLIESNTTSQSETTPATVVARKVVVEDNGISSAVEKSYDAVVMIKNYGSSGKLSGSGSGFVYKMDSEYGYIMTNHHVVEDASKIKVLFSDNKEYDGVVLGSDKYLDIAVVRVPKKAIKLIAQIGRAADLKLGDTIFAIGSPVGNEYYNTVTRGIVSGLDRKVTVSVESNSDWIINALQVDAAINPGNSGGPLLNSNGEVIGVNSLKLVDSSIEGMGFAIKIEDAMTHVTTLEKGEKIERPLLGITMINVSDSYSLARYGIRIDKDIESGIVVIEVAKDTGAADSDLKSGDVITKIDDEEVLNQAYLKYILYSHKAGDKIKVTYNRNGKTKTTEVVLTKSD